MKLSFSISSKSSSRPPKPVPKFAAEQQTDGDNASNNHEFVKEFDSSKTLADTSSKKLVIPPIENEWRPVKKMRNIDLPAVSNGQGLEFELEAPSLVDSLDSGMSFGLNLRKNSEKDVVKDGELAKGEDKEWVAPRGVNSVENVLLQKLKDDLERLLDHRGFEEFEDVPVEGFGAAVLAGYGWYEGRGIGKNPKGDVKSVEYEKRSGREGLGFVADVPAPESKKVGGKKESERKGTKEDIHVVGKDVRVIGGRDMGCKGTIVEVLKNNLLVLKLSRTGKKVRVDSSDVTDLGSKEEEKCLRKLKDLKIEESKHESHSRDEKRKDGKRSRDEDGRGSRRVSWLTSHIRVRVISKELKGGRLYLKKGEVVDVVGPNTCDIAMDVTRELIQGVDQELLETALPKHGEPVRVLYGKHKGIFGYLVEKDVNKETGVVQDADTHDLINVKLEQIAEFIGDPSLIDY